MKIKAIKIPAKELKPGDLFSTEGPTYWDRYNWAEKEVGSIGERVYVRTGAPASWAEDCYTDVYKIEVIKDEILDEKEIDDYIKHGLMPGSFVSAVICNELSEALECADSQNAIDLREIVRYVNDKAPMGCRGSFGTMLAWSKGQGLYGLTGVPR